ncbi:MAG: hypothetical protein GX083_04745 [Clostridiales bacterium]|nr:hypothetical protein [Clostridiales bacterium]
MPLIIIGFICLIGFFIYYLYIYLRGESDERSVREKYPHAFEEKTKKEEDTSDSKTLYFPTENIEKEKNKRNIK